MSDEPTDDASARGKGKRAICICDRSRDMPWCDGSHAAGVRPRIVSRAVAASGLVMCTCGKSTELPFCDRRQEACEASSDAPDDSDAGK